MHVLHSSRSETELLCKPAIVFVRWPTHIQTVTHATLSEISSTNEQQEAERQSQPANLCTWRAQQKQH